MGKTQKIFNILSILVIISMMAAPVLAQPVPASSTGIDSEVSPQSIPTNPADDAQAALLLPPAEQPGGNSKLKAEKVEATVVEVDASKGNEAAVYFVQLMDPPAALYTGGIDGYAPTNARARGEAKFNAKAPESVAYMDYLDGVQAKTIAAVNQELGRAVDVTYQFKASLNGFSAMLTPDEAAKVAQMDGVKYINRGLEYHLDTDHGPEWMGAKGIWDGTATGGLPGTKGEGVVVGVIDTGIDPWNPSFLDVGGDGYDHTNPKGKYFGVCDPANTSPPSGTTPYSATLAAVCNDKLIGMWGYTGVNHGDPRDANGHGSHTSSTAAGNVVYNAVITTPTAVYTANISGVAPHANIVMYAACCTSDALAAAKEQVILDGVDVVNYSIGASSPSNPDAAYAKQWLAVREAGIFVATSAGNAGPAANTLNSPADLPWITSVGANSHDRTFLNSITVTDGTNPPLTLDGMSMTGPLTQPARVVFSSWYTANGAISADDARLCKDDIFSGTVDFGGAIVVCERGAYGRVAKGETVRDANAGGYILAQPEEFGGGPGSLAPDPHVVPAVHIDYYKYQQLKSYMAAAGNMISGTIAGSTMVVDGAKYGDVMAAFSSRGPNNAAGMGSVIVPAVTAPGRGIWAAYHQGHGGDGDYTYNVIQGTSMASPHVAGAGALLAALHSTWTPSEIESAMMLTARSPITDDNGLKATKPFTSGAGHVDLMAAGQTGLLMSIPAGGYTDTLPSAGGDITKLNRAALGNNKCLGNCSWQRTFKSVLTATATWTASVMADSGLAVTVDPASFTIPAGGTQVVTVTADASTLPMDEWAFGKVIWTSGGQAPDVHMPLAVKPVAGIIPDKIDITTRRDAGSVQQGGFQTLAASALTIRSYGLTSGTQDTRMMVEDPTHSDPYDNVNGPGAFFVTVDVQASDVMLIAEVTESEAPDIDLFVGSGTTPSEATQLCKSTTGSWDEYCDIKGKDLTPGTYWILVQSWDASSNPPDEVTLTYLTLGSDAGNMTVTGPASVAKNEAYTLTVKWDDDALKAGDNWYGAFDLGTDAGNAGNIGLVPVYLHRVDDDVTKSVIDTVTSGAVMTVTYAITVAPNVTDKDLTYWLTDTIPAGMTYVPGSASNGATYSSGQIFWSDILQTPVGATLGYAVSDSNTDPQCDTGFGGYVNLAAFGISPRSTIAGNNKAWKAFTGQNPIQFYGVNQTGIGFTDNGFLYFGEAPSTPWPANTNIPNAANPNNIAPIFQNDMEIIYAAGTRGVSLANAGPDTSIIEYDDMQIAGGGTGRFDFEAIINSTIDNSPGAYELVFAYDNLSGTLPVSVSVGMENADASLGTQYLYGAPSGVITNGLMICYDYMSFSPQVITYKVTVPSACGGTFTNTVEHIVDNMGAKVDTAEYTLETCPVLDVNVVGGGQVWLDPLGTQAGTGNFYTSSYPVGTVVTATAIVTTNWAFSHWSGDFGSSGTAQIGSSVFPISTLVMDRSKAITATFVWSGPTIYLPVVMKQ